MRENFPNPPTGGLRAPPHPHSKYFLARFLSTLNIFEEITALLKLQYVIVVNRE
jgi:hypothetical protein